MVAVLREGENRAELRRQAARKGNRAQASFQARHPLLERGDRRIADAAVDVAVTAQGEEFRRLLGRAEDVGCGLMDRRDARARHRIGRRRPRESRGSKSRIADRAA